MRAGERLVAQQRVIVGDGGRAAPRAGQGVCQQGPAHRLAECRGVPSQRGLALVAPGDDDAAPRCGAKAAQRSHILAHHRRRRARPVRDGRRGGQSRWSAPHKWLSLRTPGLIGRQRLVRHQRLAQREVQVHDPRPALQRGPVRAAGERPDPAQPGGAGVIVVRADLEKPLGGVAEHLQLVDRLPRAVLAQLWRAVGRQQQQRHARLARLDRGGQQLRRGRPRRARHGHGQPRGLGGPEREEPRAALIDMGVTRQAPLARERQQQRGAARARRGARRPHAAARELVDERAQQDVGSDGGGHRICGVPETLILLHGFGGTHRAWDGVIERLPPERYRPLALDLPGHGEHAGAARPISFAGCVEHVLARAPARFALCGYSLGGRVALHVALAAPERVSRLVLVSTTAGIEDTAERAERRAADHRLADELMRVPFEDFIERWRTQPLFAGDPPEVGALAREDQRRNRPDALAAVLRGIGTGEMAPLWERLGELAMPTTVIAGARDAKFQALARRMVELLADGELVVAPAGHALGLERPAAVADALA